MASGDPKPYPSGTKRREIVTPNENDVLSGRGNFVNFHTGNERFRNLVKKHKIAYVECPKPKKGMFSKLIVDSIRSLDPPGRFLRQDPTTKLWEDIGDKKSLDKTRQALREGAPDLLVSLGTSESEWKVVSSRRVQANAELSEFDPQPHNIGLALAPTFSNGPLTSASTNSIDPLLVPPPVPSRDQKKCYGGQQLPIQLPQQQPPESGTGTSPIVSGSASVSASAIDQQQISQHQLLLQQQQQQQKLLERQRLLLKLEEKQRMQQQIQHATTAFDVEALEPQQDQPNRAIGLDKEAAIPATAQAQGKRPRRKNSLTFDDIFNGSKAVQKMGMSSANMSMSLGDFESNLSLAFEDSIVISAAGESRDWGSSSAGGRKNPSPLGGVGSPGPLPGGGHPSGLLSRPSLQSSMSSRSPSLFPVTAVAIDGGTGIPSTGARTGGGAGAGTDAAPPQTEPAALQGSDSAMSFSLSGSDAALLSSTMQLSSSHLSKDSLGDSGIAGAGDGNPL